MEAESCLDCRLIPALYIICVIGHIYILTSHELSVLVKTGGLVEHLSGWQSFWVFIKPLVPALVAFFAINFVVQRRRAGKERDEFLQRLKDSVTK